jgi:hypothetical protein
VSAFSAHRCKAATLERDEGVAGADVLEAVEPVEEVAVIRELLTDDGLRLEAVGGHEKRLRLQPEAQWLTLGVENRDDTAAVERMDSFRVEVVLDATR